MSAVVFRAASAAVIVLAGVGIWGLGAIGRDGHAHPELRSQQDPKQLVSEGQRVFRFETFGDEEFWTDKARMHEVVRQSVSPTMALKVGLKVDAEAIPADVAAAIKSGKVDLESPATTVTLLKLNAVVGLKGTVETVDGKDSLVRLGITCALCHSTVDDSFSKGIGRRQDGWPNRDLNVGAIIALSPAITPEQKAVYSSWGPGKYDPRYNLDGKSTPLVLPPAYGLAKVKNETYTAEGPISYWNAYVAVTQMHGQGNFSDPRLGIEVKNTPDMVTPMLPALRRLPAQPPSTAAPGGDVRRCRGGARPRWSSIGPARVATWTRTTPTTTPGRCTSRPKREWMAPTRRARPTRRTGRRRFAGSGSIRRTSTMEAPPRSTRSSTTTIACENSR